MRLVLMLVLVAACDTPAKEDYKKEAPPEERAKPPDTKAPPPKKKALTEAELGTCHLTASGAVSADQTTPGGRTATNISYWYSAEEQKTMMGVDGFVINCNGPDIRFSMVPGGGKKDGMPFKPKKYDFAAGKGDANLMIGLGKATIANPSGSIDITAFDSHHIAGSIDISGKLQPGGGDEKISGTFDLVCPNLSACDK